jgi:D-lactate dehydrogenase
MPHVVVTPHSAFYTREAILRISDETVENILAFARGEARNIVLIGSTAAV